MIFNTFKWFKKLLRNWCRRRELVRSFLSQQWFGDHFQLYVYIVTTAFAHTSVEYCKIDLYCMSWQQHISWCTKWTTVVIQEYYWLTWHEIDAVLYLRFYFFIDTQRSIVLAFPYVLPVAFVAYVSHIDKLLFILTLLIITFVILRLELHVSVLLWLSNFA